VIDLPGFEQSHGTADQAPTDRAGWRQSPLSEGAMGKLQRLVLGLSEAEVSFERRGFRSSDTNVQRRLELIGGTFLQGYHAALEVSRLKSLEIRLLEGEAETRGFAFEGAAMALGILDFMTPWKKNRFQEFLQGPGAPHKYMLHVGLGWAWARLPLSPTRSLAKLDTLLGWLAIDGYGFHEGYFNWPTYEAGRIAHPRRLNGYAARVFDQGLGRSLWFVEGADIRRVGAAISGLDSARHPDLWSGVGLACAYAGELDSHGLEELRTLAGPLADKMAQGAAFAAKARQLAGNPAPHTDAACRVLCGTTADQAAAVTDLTLPDLSGGDGTIAYEIWRQRMQAEFAGEFAKEVALA
jgi:enediyne biosynthesis protein E3